MKIFAILLVRDEADVVKSTILDAERWADRIFVVDNGSTDGTWEIVQSLANEIVVPWKQDTRPFYVGMRAEIFNHFRHEAKPGDWWCKMDSDEFYIDDPRDFLSNVPWYYQLIAKKSIDYLITKQDLEEYDFSGDFETDKSHLHYIKPVCWSEPRFFKYRENLIWQNDTEAHYPYHAGVLDPNYILVRHYRCRSPQQMQKRLDLRNSLAVTKEGHSFRHVKEKDWHELLKDRSELVLDSGNIEQYRSMPLMNNLRQAWWRNLHKEVAILMGLYR